MPAFFGGLGLIVLGGLAAALWRRRAWGERVFSIGVGLGCAVAAVPAVGVLMTGRSIEVHLPASVPGGDWVLGLDPLSAVFLLAIVAVGAAAATYGPAYLAAERAQRSAWPVHALLAALVVALALVVAARAVVPFLVAWELMTIASYLLIVTEHEHATVRRAGLLYLAVTHAGTLALFVMFAAWNRSGGDWSFAALAAATPLHERGAGVIFALALFGFGIKAGAVPAHFWLPPAHSAAPSHVSAMMSGVVIKTGIYGLLRVVALAGGAPAWWGWTVLGLGAASAVLGVLWALAQHDLKKLLAYHSVENIGIILLGIGIGALGAAYGNPAVAVLGYAAAALHTVNHALFKSVLFLGAGAVDRATGTRNLDSLGGLARRMPWLALTFFVGAAAIIGVPPLNGFVSEWLVYQGLLRAGAAQDGVRLAVFAAPLLALAAALALACFAKVVGVVFLGTARTDRALHAHEAPAGMLGPTAVLAAACGALGVLPGFIVPSLLRVGAQVASTGPGAAGGVGDTNGVLTAVVLDAQRLSWFSAGLLLALGVIWALRGLALRRRTVRHAPTWACGYAPQTPRMQYTASSFAAPLLDMFGRVSGVEVSRGGTRFHTTPGDLVLERAVRPLWVRVRGSALRLRPMQQGRLHVYLLYVVVTLLAVLGFLVFWPE